MIRIVLSSTVVYCHPTCQSALWALTLHFLWESGKVDFKLLQNLFYIFDKYEHTKHFVVKK